MWEQEFEKVEKRGGGGHLRFDLQSRWVLTRDPRGKENNSQYMPLGTSSNHTVC